MVEIIVNPGVVGVIVGFVDTVLDQWTDAEIFSEEFAQPHAVIALVGGESLQLARVLRASCLKMSASLPPLVVVQCKSRIRFVSVSTSFVALRSCTSYFILLQYERLAGERSKYVASIAPIGPVLCSCADCCSSVRHTFISILSNARHNVDG